MLDMKLITHCVVGITRDRSCRAFGTPTPPQSRVGTRWAILSQYGNRFREADLYSNIVGDDFHTCVHARSNANRCAARPEQSRLRSGGKIVRGLFFAGTPESCSSTAWTPAGPEPGSIARPAYESWEGH